MKNKNILLGVTGGIACYKAAALTSKLVQSGYSVKVMMTKSATNFVSPLTFQALSRNEVYTDTFIENNPEVIAHIDLADWADLCLVAPATANMLAKLAHGLADDMVSTTLLATTAPVWIAPAMNVHMYQHPAVKKNIQVLNEFGHRFIEPGDGYLACGYVGKGRLEEPETIVAHIDQHFTKPYQPLKGKKVLITAGPTKEKIDPVRYLTNHSSGKMGYALAEEAEKMGAEVILISGPSTLSVPNGVKFISIETAKEMYDHVLNYFPTVDIVIKSAAVADYRPTQTSQQKIKKKDDNLIVEFERTIDILMELGKQKEHQYLVGFAAETEKLEEHALGKLERKNADMIIANDITTKGAGFSADTNIVTIVQKNQRPKKLPLLSKNETARQILDEIVNNLAKEDQK
ncbi:bifunctional phosphopantothenoylcysteine decarboxylase/phosphopantothenate--cysteine ligase CoaBC [Bacillus sp. SD088]|uniref:bifunctional phosphopantothenoylcysteine decarboxylase/phosphopantothenate--cysteine ligase CoaBC n=1 Tax=Bacillus sp. SD088 TaxID=2782012 RepID=UPI001A976E92|nr:bifunctional phosphopantothenoylcysteine decarboxylase/phosphopantothenate--cysteine ligase CoaBC [Bacillus sp. SD088]MBO0994326.1 bifunctional phosphopantothenoylcysteine decarboxylase/phosphopantothenate--cysteine ligase CoaBC [Bacillus sp. SD088]